MSVLKKFKLDNKVIIITGGAGLLGVKHAEAVIEAGGIPILVDIDQDKLSKLEVFSAGAEKYCADITKEDELLELLEFVKSKYNRLDGLVNNASVNPSMGREGVSNSSRLEDYSLDFLRFEMDVGLAGALLCTKVFGTYMSKTSKGVIVNISSDLGLIAPNQSLYKNPEIDDAFQAVKPVGYSIIKHGLIGLTKYTATYWADKNIRCNALAPGGIENSQNSLFLKKIKKLIPMGRMAIVDEYMAAIVFLLSEASSYMNGSILSIDGGRSCW